MNAFVIRGRSKSTFAQNFQFLTPPYPLVCSCSFYMSDRLGNSYNDGEVDSHHPTMFPKNISHSLNFKLDKKSLKFQKKIIMLLIFRSKIEKSFCSLFSSYKTLLRRYKVYPTIEHLHYES